MQNNAQNNTQNAQNAQNKKQGGAQNAQNAQNKKQQGDAQNNVPLSGEDCR